MKYLKALVAVLLFMPGCGSATALHNIEVYHELYTPFYTTGNDLMDKITDNHGDGYEDLYGTRNMRTVLHGILYRGGSNNSYNKYGKRDNQNPMPQIGLDNLCKEGFSSAIYLYNNNFKPYRTACVDRWGNENTFEYLHISPFTEAGVRKILKTIYASIAGKSNGPVYAGCFNGWHASGAVSAAALKQWCDFSGKEAIKYWIEGTDGDSNYSPVKQVINAFEKLPELEISDDLKFRICPQNPYHKE